MISILSSWVIQTKKKSWIDPTFKAVLFHGDDKKGEFDTEISMVAYMNDDKSFTLIDGK